MRSFRSLVVAAAVCFAASVGAPSASITVSGASYPSGLVWLALGDSYSSGEGLRYVDTDANPSDRRCERATGRSTVNNGQGSRSWPTIAYDELRGDIENSTFRLLACTGAVSNEIHEQYRDEWSVAEQGRADLVTLSVGGNNLGFADVISDCIGISLSGTTNVVVGGVSAFALNPALGCSTSEVELRDRIDLLVGDSGVGPDGNQTLRDMYQELANNAVTRGGHVVVAGYPNLIEESSKWSLGWFEGNRCSRVRRADTAMLRSAAGYLNEKIANLVSAVDGEFNDVSFHWVDVSKIYESEDGRHGLCTGDPWVNGITFGILGPKADDIPFRIERSFHPNQKGHDATGAVVADLVKGLDWTDLGRQVPEPDTSSGAPQLEGLDIAFAQLLLDVADFGPLDYDGTLGPASMDAVRRFQASLGLAATGTIDDTTWQQLLTATAEQTGIRLCQSHLPRPASFIFPRDCADNTMYVDFTWTQWTAEGAVGNGVRRTFCFGFDCNVENDPDNSPTFIDTAVTVKFSEAKPLQCGDSPTPYLEFTGAQVLADGAVIDEYTLEGPFC